MHLEPGEVHEDDAALRLAKTLAGKGVFFDPHPSEGKIQLKAAHRGLLKVDVDALIRINLVSDISCSSRHTNTVVEHKDIIAGVRAIPLIIDEKNLEKAEKIAMETEDLFSVKPFLTPNTGLVITGNEVFSGLINDKFAPIIRNKLQADTQSLRTKLLFLILSLLLLAAVSSWMIAQGMVRRRLYQKELYRSANFDKLTDLPNRALFLDRLNQNLKQSKRYGRKFALLFIDLDGFKSVNDTLGHDAGDKLLAKTAKRIQNCVREADTVARMGGDEFTVILSSITSVDDAQTVAQKIISTLSTPFKIGNQEAQIGASIGISAYPDNGMDAEILLKNADDAMYLAKNSGKNDCRLSPR